MPNGLEVQNPYLVTVGTEALDFQRRSLAARARAQDCRHHSKKVGSALKQSINERNIGNATIWQIPSIPSLSLFL